MEQDSFLSMGQCIIQRVSGGKATRQVRDDDAVGMPGVACLNGDGIAHDSKPDFRFTAFVDTSPVDLEVI